MKQDNKMNGTVLWYDVNRGYGFLQGEDELQYFLHRSNILNQVQLLPQDEVEFIPSVNEKGTVALNVIRIE